MTCSSRIMVMAGGTGGHVFPALAVAKELRLRGCDIQWLGTRNGIEAQLVPDADIPLHFLTISGVRGKGFTTLIKAPWKLLNSIWEAMALLRQQKPDLVLGLGGYASGPGGIAAWLLRIPVVIHEQNAKPGTTNKWLAKIANRVLTAFPNALPNSIFTGNPVRNEIADLPEPAARFTDQNSPLKVLVLGGSLGAQALNEMLPIAVSSFVQSKQMCVRHQTGQKHYDSTHALYQTHNVEAEVSAFIRDMAEALSWADLVVCRSGALTVSELSAVGVASILIPFPYAIDDHQTANAQWLVDRGAAELYQQKTLTPELLRSRFEYFIARRKRLVEMAEAARSAAMPNATRVCADLCLEVIHDGR